MARPIFVSFCYQDDVTKVHQILNMGLVEGQKILNPNDFEKIKLKGDIAIKNWIDEQLKYKQCLIVLVGENTANRKWVQYEIKEADRRNIPIFGIYIHNIKGLVGYKKKGDNPFITVFGYEKYKCYDPSHMEYPGATAYDTIKNNINNWIETARSSKYYF